MSADSGDIGQFIVELQSYSNHRLAFPEDIAVLINAANRESLEEVFLDAIFHAKFAVKTQEVMQRIGPNGEGFGKLSGEFQQSIERVSALLKTLVKESPDEIKTHFVRTYFGLSPENFANLLKLLGDLSWVKNWEVDAKPLPFKEIQSAKTNRSRSPRHPERTNGMAHSEELGRISKGSRLGLLLTIIFLTVNPPFSIFGWGIGLLMFAIFLYIVLASYCVARKDIHNSSTAIK